MNELFWLLLPVAALSGWLTAKYNLWSQPPSFPSISADYFKGLNYLLNEQPDKAIDIFVELIDDDIDAEAIETHLALGALFRRRGEVNRAIQIHQNLMAQTTLNEQQRHQAALELGLDYQRAGLLDRAEDLFTELVEVKAHRVYAYQRLLDIYQQEHEWEKAITTAQQLQQVSDEDITYLIAHYYCEQAEILYQQKQYDIALQKLTLALKIDKNCVRASLLEGQLALDMCQLEKAILAFKRVEQQDLDYLTEIIAALQTCYHKLDKPDEFKQYLHHVLMNYGGVTPLLVLASMLENQKGGLHAADFVVQYLHDRPSIRGLDYLLDLALENSESITREHLLLLKGMTTQLLKDKPIYKCHQCGFTGKSLHWQCPSCKHWNTIKPIQGIDGE